MNTALATSTDSITGTFSNFENSVALITGANRGIDPAERTMWFLWITVCHPDSTDQSAGDVVLVPVESMDRIVIIDLHEVVQLDSWGMSIFLEAMQRITAEGGNLVLIRIQDAVRRVLKTTMLDQVFHICANRNEALAQFDYRAAA